MKTYITALKGIAILGVILVHAPLLIEGISPYIMQICKPGQLGCQLFFIISGYLMIHSWEKLSSLSLSFSQKYWFFIRKRYFSLAPIYIISIIFYQILSYISTDCLHVDFFYRIVHNPLSIILNIFLLNGLDVLYFNRIVPGGWYIGVIMLFYIMLPFIYELYHHLIGKLKNSIYFIPVFFTLLSFAIQAIVALSYRTWDYSDRGTFLNYSIINQLPCMMVGISIAFKEKRSGLYARRNVMKLIITSFIALLYYYLFRNYGLAQIFQPIIVSIPFCYLFIYMKTNFSSIPQLIANFLTHWGELSFAAYFTNFLGTMMFAWIITLLFSIDRPNLLFLILIIPMYIITYYLAKPLNKFIKVLR